jgi:hypothetical protein
VSPAAVRRAATAAVSLAGERRGVERLAAVPHGGGPCVAPLAVQHDAAPNETTEPSESTAPGEPAPHAQLGR